MEYNAGNRIYKRAIALLKFWQSYNKFHLEMNKYLTS
jgi:hypothetical protein